MLTDELSQDRYRIGHGNYDGFAYVAAEAYFHLAGGHDAGSSRCSSSTGQEPLVAGPLRPGHRPHPRPA